MNPEQISSKSRVLAPCHFRLLPNLSSSLACEVRFGPSARGPLARTVIQAPYGRFNARSTLPLLPPASSGPLVPARHVPNESRTATPTLPRSPTQNASTQAAARRTPYETQSSKAPGKQGTVPGLPGRCSGATRHRRKEMLSGHARKRGMQYAKRSRQEALCVGYNMPSDHAVGSMGVGNMPSDHARKHCA